MICVPVETLNAKAAKMPLAYLEDCKAAARTSTESQWCFEESDFYRIRRKYRGYAVSEADQFRAGEVITGCCDRADQY